MTDETTLSLTGVARPTVYIPADVEAKMHLYMAHAKHEISGLAKAEMDEDGDIIISDPVIFEQESDASESTLDSAAVGKFIYEQYKEHGVDPALWKCWWHKHTASLFWSGTDNEQMTNFALADGEWMLGIVGLDDHTYRARLDHYGDTFGRFEQLTVDHLDIQVYRAEDQELSDAIKAEVAAKVKEPPPTTSGWVSGTKGPNLNLSELYRLKNVYRTKGLKNMSPSEFAQFEELLQDSASKWTPSPEEKSMLEAIEDWYLAEYSNDKSTLESFGHLH